MVYMLFGGVCSCMDILADLVNDNSTAGLRLPWQASMGNTSEGHFESGTCRTSAQTGVSASLNAMGKTCSLSPASTLKRCQRHTMCITHWGGMRIS